MNKDLNKTKEQLASELNDLRNKSIEREKMQEAANQQLVDTEQQLRAANQHLEANNQQLLSIEQQLRVSNQQLIERLKELDCFYGISKIVEIPDISLEEIYQRTVKLISDSWQYPEIAVCRIIFNGLEYKTHNFKKTKWSQCGDIIIDGKHIGSVEVCYLKKMPDSDEGPFLKEERLLLDALAERLGRITERTQAEEELKTTNQQLTANNQQLTASEQQIMATNSQLEANNQQLSASEQQLMAANQQLIASEHELKNNQNFLNRIIDQSPFSTWVSDEKGVVIRCNAALENVLNITKEQLIGKYNVFEDEIAKEQGLIPKIRTVFENGKTANFMLEWDPNKLGYKNSIKVHLEATMFPIHDEKGNLTNVVNHWIDITARKQAEEKARAANQQLRANNQQLRASEQQLKAANQQLIASEHELKKEKNFSEKIVETASAIIVGLDKEHKIRIFNKGAEIITGYTKAEVIGKDWFKIFFPKKMLNKMNKVWEDAWGITSHSYENPILSKAGKEIIVSWQSTGIYEREDVSEHLFISIGEDITERKKAEKSLQQSEERFRLFMDQFPGVASINKPGECFSFANQQMCDFYGLTNEKIVGLNFEEFVPTDVLSKIKYQDQKVVSEGCVLKVEESINDEFGQKKWLTTKFPILQRDQQLLIGLVSVDITERKKAEKNLQKSEEKFRSYIENAPDGVFIVNQKGEFIEVNQAASNITGYTENELLELTIPELIQQEYLEKAKNHFQAVTKDGFAKGEMGYVTKSGEKKFWSVDAVKLSDTRFLGFVKDITERKQTEEELRKSEIQKQALLDGTTDMIIHVDTNLQIIWANKTALTAKPDVIGMICYECYVGKEKPCKDCPVMKSIQSGNIESSIMYHAAAETVQGESYWELIGVPMKDDAGNITGAIEIGRDITERKLGEEALKKRMNELEIFNEATVGRELKMIELKKEINEILTKTGQKPKYEIIV